MPEFVNHVAASSGEQSVSEQHCTVQTSGDSAGRTDNNRRSDDFFGDQAVCPTCRGVGHIPNSVNQEMMALIPLSDKRLRPRRTVLYVVIAVVLCVIIGGLLLFFLFPRTVNLSSTRPSLQPTNIYINVTSEILFLTVTNYFNLTNNNFFAVDIVALEVDAYYDQRIIAKETNSTRLTLPMRFTMLHYITMNVTFREEKRYIIDACSERKDMVLLFPFQSTATIEYFGKSEQSHLDTYQYVHCSPKT